MLKDNIRRLRTRAEMTQAEVANALGYTMWETGDRKPPSDLIPKIAEVLHCTINDLYEER